MHVSIDLIFAKKKNASTRSTQSATHCGQHKPQVARSLLFLSIVITTNIYQFLHTTLIRATLYTSIRVYTRMCFHKHHSMLNFDDLQKKLKKIQTSYFLINTTVCLILMNYKKLTSTTVYSILTICKKNRKKKGEFGRFAFFFSNTLYI